MDKWTGLQKTGMQIDKLMDGQKDRQTDRWPERLNDRQLNEQIDG